MRFGRFSFGSIEVDGEIYDHDLIVDRGRIRKRTRGPFKSFRNVLSRPVPASSDLGPPPRGR